MKRKTVYGTAYFISRDAAARYYKPYEGGFSAACKAVNRKIEEGSIHISPIGPALKPGERSYVNNEEGRWFVEVKQ